MKSSKVKSGLLLSGLALYAGLSGAVAQPSRFSYNKFTDKKGDTLNYRLLFPDYDTIRKYPLVIFLHGAGERGNDNEAQLKWGVMNFSIDQMMIMHPTFILAPQCPKDQEWANFDESGDGLSLKLNISPSIQMELLIKLIHELTKKFAIDTNRIYITGLSMGGYGTFDAIQRYPGLFAAAVPVCGGGDVSRAESIAKIPIWIFHGSEDAAVNPLLSIEMTSALTKAGGHPGFTFYPEVGHFSWLGAYNDPLMIDWLFRQHK